ncbi:twin-arginine translocase TatA/TatE family subunit [Pannonibacter sp. Q-1]|uniref:Sec-independent protein translocase protein TatA n=2 Tax=Pannonibacter TaxID=227873 RepID=A0A0L0ISD4_9HYPH|nr:MULTISPECIES: twin-arginine translocase TatA/TatE family subunit [Pannonibacter]ALV28873.1 preprotein translocase subunit TatA [Pannonibacter phragmitetus]KND16377.1 preprotein translocase subunit TatA [Pannonibacter phragmitetus]MBA4207212.1 twin-arginine translocase subunit TatA [Polymorphum sp.]
MSIGIWQLLIIAVIVILLFGRGKISDLMGDVAKGIKSFKKGMAEDDTAEKAPEASKTIEHKPADPVAADKVQDQSKAG